MSNYVFISSQSRHESADAAHCFELATDLAADGHVVTVYLVQNGVLAACGADASLAAAANAGVHLLADDFSLRERGIAERQVHGSVKLSPLDFVVDRLAAGDKVVWH